MRKVTSVSHAQKTLATLLFCFPCFGLAQSLRQVTVAAQGKADFRSVQDAVDHAPAEGEIIRLAAGKYREKVHIHTANIHLVGMGKNPDDVVLSWGDSARDAGGTGKSGSVSVDADGFQAENLTIENTWELEHTRT